MYSKYFYSIDLLSNARLNWNTLINFSRISQENIPGFSFLYSSIVATLGFEPPIAFGRMDPVS